jgi:hypothetical protein
MSVKVEVLDPIISHEKDTFWNQLEKYAKNCPISYSSQGYCFNAIGDNVFGKPYKNYDYFDVAEDEGEKIRIYWVESEYEIVVEDWDDADEWPIVESDDIQTKGFDD